MFMAKMSPKTVVASSKETPWSARFDVAFVGSHSKLYGTSPSYRRFDSFRELIGITLQNETRAAAGMIAGTTRRVGSI